MASFKRDRVALEVLKGVAGEALYLDGYRLAGPRDNGMMRQLKSWQVDPKDIAAALGAKFVEAVR